MHRQDFDFVFLCLEAEFLKGRLHALLCAPGNPA
jgi:hypothetical protein